MLAPVERSLRKSFEGEEGAGGFLVSAISGKDHGWRLCQDHEIQPK